jgi:hypothetical protein
LEEKEKLSTFFEVEPSPSLASSSPAVLFFLALGFGFVSVTVTGCEAIRPERLGGSAAALSSVAAAAFLGGMVEVEIQGTTLGRHLNPWLLKGVQCPICTFFKLF